MTNNTLNWVDNAVLINEIHMEQLLNAVTEKYDIQFDKEDKEQLIIEAGKKFDKLQFDADNNATDKEFYIMSQKDNEIHLVCGVEENVNYMETINYALRKLGFKGDVYADRLFAMGFNSPARIIKWKFDGKIFIDAELLDNEKLIDEIKQESYKFIRDNKQNVQSIIENKRYYDFHFRNGGIEKLLTGELIK